MFPKHGSEQGTQFQPVPLEKVETYIVVKPENVGKPVKKQITWNDLSELEQNVTKLIMQGKYGEASELTGYGKARTYDKNVLHNFLNAVSLQHDLSLGWAMTNDSVRNIVG